MSDLPDNPLFPYCVVIVAVVPLAVTRSTKVRKLKSAHKFYYSDSFEPCLYTQCYHVLIDNCLPVEKPASPSPEAEDAAGSGNNARVLILSFLSKMLIKYVVLP